MFQHHSVKTQRVQYSHLLPVVPVPANGTRFVPSDFITVCLAASAGTAREPRSMQDVHVGQYFQQTAAPAAT
jgi:hypothetical protein